MKTISIARSPRLALAFALGTITATSAIVPSAAQATVDQASAQQIGESLVEALNGRRADRRNWGFAHIKSERVRGAEIEKLDRLALRLADVSLSGVRAAENRVALDIRDSRGKTGTVELTMDDESEPGVLGVATSGF